MHHCTFRGLVALAVLVGLLSASARLGAQGATAPYPGTAVLAPLSAVTFVQQQPTSGPPLPAAPGALTVQSAAFVTTTVSYDGGTLTVAAPTGQLVVFTSGCTAVPANPAACAVVPCGQECVGGPPAYDPGRGRVSFTTAARVVYPAGWNLVAGPEGSQLVGASDPLYTWRSGDTAYDEVPAAEPLHACWGYWAYFPTGGSLVPASGVYTSCTVAAAPGEQVLVGNPSALFEAQLFGAVPEATLLYNPDTGFRVARTTLPPGQGAWAESAATDAATGILVQPMPAHIPTIP